MDLIALLQNYKWVILFYAVIILLIYLNRHKFEFQGRFIALYRTKVGLRLMDKIANLSRQVH